MVDPGSGLLGAVSWEINASRERSWRRTKGEKW